MKTITTQQEAYELIPEFKTFIEDSYGYDIDSDEVSVTRDTVDNFLQDKNVKIYKRRENFAKDSNFYGFKFYDLHHKKQHLHIYLLDVGEFRLCIIN